MDKYIITFMVCVSILASGYIIKSGMITHSEALHVADNNYPYIFFHSYDGKLRACSMAMYDVEADDNSGLLMISKNRGLFVQCSEWFTGKTQAYEINNRNYFMPEGLTEQQAAELVLQMESKRKNTINDKQDNGVTSQDKKK